MKDATALDTDQVYRRRFADLDAYRDRLWKLLCRDFFQRYIPPEATLIELAAGHCEFINNIRARERIAVDINPDTARYARSEVKVISAPAWDIRAVPDAYADVIFMSNLLEHLTKEQIVATMTESRRLLKTGGRLLILQPNIRYLTKDYWMFFDHITPIDDRALCEVLELKGFSIRYCLTQFLPFTMKRKIPRNLLLVKLYLHLPFLWKLFGEQSFVYASK